MKTTISSATIFKPVSIELTFQSQEELDVFGSIIDSWVIKSVVEEMGGEWPDWQVFRKAGASMALTRKLQKALKAKLSDPLI